MVLSVFRDGYVCILNVIGGVAVVRCAAWYYTCKLKRARSWDRMNQPGYIVSKSAQDDIEQILQTFSQPMGEVPVDEGAICSILLYETKQHDSKSRTYIEFLTQSSLGKKTKAI